MKVSFALFLFLQLVVMCSVVAVSVCHASELGASGSTPDQVQVLREEWTDAARERTLPVKIYLPPGPVTPRPVIVFSHGLGGSRDAAPYLGNAWAKRGYLCVFLQHPGSDSSLWQGARGRDEVIQALRQGANGQAALNRIKDVRFAIDHLQELSDRKTSFGGYIDMNAIGMSGHSFGALTSLWIAGQKMGWNENSRGMSLGDPRVKAAIYLSPGAYKGRLPAKTAFGNISIPGMVLTGSEDVDPVRGSQPEERAANFDYIQAHDQYLLFFDGAAHQTFGGRKRTGPDAQLDEKIEGEVAEVTARFWDAYLKHDRQDLAWLKGDQLNGFLGKSATVKKK